jgi:phospholipid-binding lipoprotein MlaA
MLLIGCSSTPKKDAAPPVPEKISAGKKQQANNKAVSESVSDKSLPKNIKVEEEIECIDFSSELGGNDPAEGFNRSMYAVNDFFLRWVFRPVGHVYGSVCPRPALDAINRFTENLAFPKRMFSSFLQAKFKGGGIVFLRFMTNTTLGVAGFFDPADEWFGLEFQDEDFGQAFASWGIGPGCYLFLPGEGPTNVRDGVGLIFDYALDPKTYIYGGQGFTKLNKGMRAYPDYDQLRRGAADPYQVFKDYWWMRRRLQIEDWESVKIASLKKNNPGHVKNPYPAKKGNPGNEEFGEFVEMERYKDQGEAINTLRVGTFDIQRDNVSLWPYLSFFNDDFINQSYVREVKVIKNKPEMGYRYWKYKDNPEAPLAVVLPGLGSHFSNSTLTALAELLNNNGYSVAALSNALNWDFMETASSVLTPGFTPIDAADSRKAICKVVDDLEKNVGLRPARIVLVGYSLGGLHTLFISQMEEHDSRIGIDRYLAINPPVDLYYGIKQLDKFFNVWKKWPRDEVVNRAVTAAGKYMLVMKNQYPWRDNFKELYKKGQAEVKQNPDGTFYCGISVDDRYKLNFTDEEAQLLIGYAFKRTAEEIVVSIHKRQKLDAIKTPYSWGGRAEVYKELAPFTFKQYLDKVLVKEYSKKYKREVKIEELNSKSGMLALEEHLAENPEVRVIHTLDDFLESDEHRRWMKKVLGGRIVFFEYGGHLGNLYIDKIQDTIIDMLKSRKNVIKKPDKSPETKNVASKTLPAKTRS